MFDLVLLFAFPLLLFEMVLSLLLLFCRVFVVILLDSSLSRYFLLVREQGGLCRYLLLCFASCYVRAHMNALRLSPSHFLFVSCSFALFFLLSSPSSGSYTRRVLIFICLEDGNGTVWYRVRLLSFGSRRCTIFVAERRVDDDDDDDDGGEDAVIVAHLPILHVVASRFGFLFRWH